MQTVLRLTIAVLCMLSVSAYVGPAQADESLQSGPEIYEKQCARCHGAHGEGTAEHYGEPLIGDRSILELAETIAKTMPEDKEQKCTPEQARKVAEYIHAAFYSPLAQERNRPARVELSRLTVRQYQNTVSDLLGSFRHPQQPFDSRRGLAGEYYRKRSFRRDDRRLERLDPEIHFDFATASPDGDKIEPHEFSIRWEGSVLAPDTGDYEFIVRTEHAARLWVNETEESRPLIDAWVKSGNETEYRGSLKLLGGYSYPIRLEFSKAKQGVDDSDKDKDQPKPAVQASISLLWKRPNRLEEVIPARCLSPVASPTRFVTSAPFPPDDRSIGYERGTTISKAWDEATTEAAIEAAAYVEEHLRELTGVRGSDGDRRSELKSWSYRFTERAFRRPLSDAERQLYVDRHFSDDLPPEVAVRRVVLIALKSPRFLFPAVSGTRENDSASRSGEAGYDVATRLSYALWDSMPDDQLRLAAANGSLSSDEAATQQATAQQARRMLDDPRFRAKLRAFFLHWLRADQVQDLAKDRQRYPDFDERAAEDLRTSLELTLDDLLAAEAIDFRQLFQANDFYVNGRLARLYGVQLPPDAAFQKVALDSEHRAGIVGHPYLLTAFAYSADSSPIHRGVFVSRNLLGRALRPPPEAFTPLPAEAHPKLTTRERIELQTKAESCNVCHAMINPLGFPFEHFDAIGRYRIDESGRPIDASGSYRTRAGETVKFHGARELAAYLAASDETHSTFVEQLFHHLVKQPVRAYGSAMLPELKRSFAENNYDVRKLALEIAIRTANVPPAETGN